MSKAVLVFWSGTGNTEAMAEAIAKGARDAGNDLTVLNVSDADAGKVAAFEQIILGCPAMGAEVLEESEFDPFFTELEPMISDKKVALFGSYGWGDGEWMRLWEERVHNSKALLFETGLMVNEVPDARGLADCEAFGKRFAQLA